MRQTKLASSLVNFRAHYKTVWLHFFRETGTMGTLASRSEDGVRGQALGALLRRYGGAAPETFWDCIMYMKKSCNLVHFGRKMVRNAVHNAFLNTLRRRSLAFGSCSAMRMEFPRIILGLIPYGIPTHHPRTYPLRNSHTSSSNLSLTRTAFRGEGEGTGGRGDEKFIRGLVAPAT